MKWAYTWCILGALAMACPVYAANTQAKKADTADVPALSQSPEAASPQGQAQQAPNYGLDEPEPEAEAAAQGQRGSAAAGAPAQSSDKYIVQPGDTLWDICAKQLNNPWYWQKVWAFNPQIANPHWIYPGNVIYFQSIDQMGTLVAMQDGSKLGEGVGSDQMGDIPEVVDVNAWGTVAEGGKYQLDKYLANISKNFNFYSFRRDGFISGNSIAPDGEIANSPAEAISLAQGDMIYIRPRDLSSFAIGQSYQIFRQEGEVIHPVTEKSVGYRIRILGKAVVKRIGDKVVTAQIEQSYEPISRGDLLRAWKNPNKDIKVERNKITLKGYIVATHLDKDTLADSELAYLDKGISQGIEEGNRLFVVRQFDGNDDANGFDTKDLPYEKIGEVLVLSAGSNTSVALVTRSLTTLRSGDQVVMEKNY